ncbi:MAG TPA: FAD/NAD(P)-binding protein [Anaerolineales bacterium]|jgi:NAD(P)H-flavin reductase
MTARPPTLAQLPQVLLGPAWARLESIQPEVEGISTFWLRFEDEELASTYRFQAGQFNMLYLPGYGESAISISSDPAVPDRLGHTIRFVGNVTRAFNRLRPGDLVGVRGPFGSTWPIDQLPGQDVILATGGIGLAPLRPVVYRLLAERHKYGRIVLLYGARTPGDLLYTSEFDAWQQAGIETVVSVDRADETWQGHVGVVPMLFYRLRVDPEKTWILSCGPEIMMRFVVYEALARRIAPERIFLSLERNMKCGQGFCGHCQLGPLFICKQGPVFDYQTLEPYLQVEDF